MNSAGSGQAEPLARGPSPLRPGGSSGCARAVGEASPLLPPKQTDAQAEVEADEDAPVVGRNNVFEFDYAALRRAATTRYEFDGESRR
jgi:hypothetical protein